MKKALQIFLFLLLIVSFFSACKKAGSDPIPGSTDKEIISFGLNTADNVALDSAQVALKIIADTIRIAVPYSVKLTNLIPVIKIKGKRIHPESNIPQDFTNTVKYIVTAEDGTTKNYFVSITKELSPEKDITSFKLQNANGILIDSATTKIVIKDNRIDAEVPFYVSLASLKPIIAINGKSISAKENAPYNFNNPVSYTVTAEDGSTKDYVVQIKHSAFKNVVYIGSFDKTFMALNAVTGELIWKYTGAASFSTSNPFYYKGMVYAGSADGYMYAFDAIDGSIKWKFYTSIYINSGLQLGIISHSFAADGALYFSDVKGNFYSLNATTGTLIWIREGEPNSLYFNATVSNDLVFVTNVNGYLYAMEPKTGAVKWKYQALDGFYGQAGVVHNGILFICGNTYLYAFDTSTGKLKWKSEAFTLPLHCSPKIYDGMIYVQTRYLSSTQKGSVYALSEETGSVIWTGLKNTAFSGGLTVGNDFVYISTDDSYFYALNAKTGSMVWQKSILPNSVGTSTGNGVVFVGATATYFIYAIEPKTSTTVWKYPSAVSSSKPCVVDDSGNFTGN